MLNVLHDVAVEDPDADADTSGLLYELYSHSDVFLPFFSLPHCF